MLSSEVSIFCLVDTNPLLIEESMVQLIVFYALIESGKEKQKPFPSIARQSLRRKNTSCVTNLSSYNLG